MFYFRFAPQAPCNFGGVGTDTAAIAVTSSTVFERGGKGTPLLTVVVVVAKRVDVVVAIVLLLGRSTTEVSEMVLLLPKGGPLIKEGHTPRELGDTITFFVLLGLSNGLIL